MKRMYKIIFISLLVFTMINLYGCLRQQISLDELSGSINIKGSDTMVDLGANWAEKFMDQHPRVNISVSGGGSGTGIKALIEGTTDITQSSRTMKAEEIAAAREKGIEAFEIKVGLDGLSVIVNPGNPIEELTLEQISLIFQGLINNWKEFGWEDKPIVLLSREATSGTHIYFKESVVQLKDKKAEYSPTVLLLPSSTAIVKEVSANKYTIGYVGLGFVSKNVKALKIAKDKESEYFYPTIESVSQRKYPISRPLFFYTNGQPKGLVKEFVDFVLGVEGQNILKTLDFVPLKE